jgi:hypothetical protein
MSNGDNLASTLLVEIHSTSHIPAIPKMAVVAEHCHHCCGELFASKHYHVESIPSYSSGSQRIGNKECLELIPELWARNIKARY